MGVSVYINFNGNCREAAEYYAAVFGTEKPQMMTFGEAPPDPNFSLPEEAKHLIMHTQLQVEGSTIMLSDVFPGMPFTAGNNISIVVTSKEEDVVKSLFHQLKEGGTIRMELQETFWSKCYGMLEDKFGIQWQISHESEEPR
ncbi:PhnB protein [Evansella caseinilytica]|uniref:PhnB protein n=1 Tax=Evansella caseinilytica TaxID=1503961 RepID=A0A1H3R3Q0_9BACI|nr:VOC family protein [Evansella caseinilytica]SDZ19858.1 PhnB protein [Evansella caseinilytica]